MGKNRLFMFSRRVWRPILAATFIFFVIRSAGCQFDITGNPDVSLLTVHVFPDTAVVPMGGQLVLNASITGYANDGSITWTVEGTNNGSINGSGLSATYTATGLNALRLPPVIRVRAVPNEDPSRYVVCNIYISTPQVDMPQDTSFVVSPSAVRILTNHLQQFTLDTITSFGPVGPVVWSLRSGPGSVTSTGLYSPPSAVIDSTIAVIRATSIADTGVYAEATITILNEQDSLLCFTRDVLPIVSSSCGTSGCHDAGSHAGGYNFNTYSGTIPSVRGTTARSTRLYNSIIQVEASSRMPKPPAPALTPNQVRTIGRWIDEGALDCQ